MGGKLFTLTTLRLRLKSGHTPRRKSQGLDPAIASRVDLGSMRLKIKMLRAGRRLAYWDNCSSEVNRDRKFQIPHSGRPGSSQPAAPPPIFLCGFRFSSFLISWLQNLFVMFTGATLDGEPLLTRGPPTPRRPRPGHTECGIQNAECGIPDLRVRDPTVREGTF